MDINIITSYILIFLGITLWVILIPGGKKIPHKVSDCITVFGGAFLLASCFINLIPHMFVQGFETPNLHIKIGLAALVGFLIQTLLEMMTNSMEHGHNHCHDCHEEEEYSHEHHHNHHVHPTTGLIIGLSIHAFLEGMPLVDSGCDIHQSLLYGIVLHNIPIALVLVAIFMHNGYGTLKSFLLLSIFAIMTPLGSMCNLLFVPDNAIVQAMIMGVVVGILLHVSVSILFDSETDNRWLKLALVIVAFAAAYFTPGCPEIYV